MQTSLRPWLTTGVALASVGVIAASSITPTPPALMAAVPTISAPTVHTTAFELPYILTLPIVRQYVANTIESWVVYLGGFAQAGVGLVESLAAIPQTLVTITQQLLSLDFVGAFNTLSAAIRDSVIAVGQPLLDSWIERRQKVLAVQTALQAAVPEAFISVVNGTLAAANGVTTSVIAGTQNLVAAILSLDLSNIVDATIDGTKNFVVSLAQGAGDIVGGIEGAQLLIATALATPAPSTAKTPAVTAVPDLGTDKVVTLAVAPDSEGADTSEPAEASVAETTTPDTSVSNAPTASRSDEKATHSVKTKRSGSKTTSGQGVSETSKRAAHHAGAAAKKPAEAKTESASASASAE
ncbi:hypothetical protein BH09ACT7_BH09ACT7_34890 [soil metagenome]